MPKEPLPLHLLFPLEHFPDRSTKWLLEFGENVRGLMEIVASDLVEQLDFSQLRHVNRTFIPDNLREQESDIVYAVPFRGQDSGEVWIYILIEHQSTVDVTMGFRVLFYMVQIWDSQRREWEDKKVPKSQWKFRPIIPIVFHTGEQKWETPISMETVMDLPDELRRFVPSFDTLFLGVKAEEPARLTQTGHIFGQLLTVIQKENASKDEITDALVKAIEHINALPEEQSNQWQRAIFYLYLLIFHRRPREEHDELKNLVYQHIQTSQREMEGEEMAQTMAEYLVEQAEKRGEERGEKRGEERGEKRGTLRAKREWALKVLQMRFGSVPESVVKQIRSMRSVSRLEAIFEKAATATTLDEIEF
jgi:hypothetical protein